MDCTVKSFEALPVMLTVKDLQAVLGVSHVKAWSLTKEPGFPAIRLGKRIIIPRDKLLQWMERKADEPLVSYK